MYNFENQPGISIDEEFGSREEYQQWTLGEGKDLSEKFQAYASQVHTDEEDDLLRAGELEIAMEGMAEMIGELEQSVEAASANGQRYKIIRTYLDESKRTKQMKNHPASYFAYHY